MLNEYLHVLMKISVLELKTFLRKCIDLYIKKNILETAKETLMYRTVLWTLWERERVERFGRMALKHVKYHI